MGAKKWFSNLQNVEKRSYSSTCTIREVLRPAFQQAYNDDLIRKNPFDFPVSDVVVNNTKKEKLLLRNKKKLFWNLLKIIIVIIDISMVCIFYFIQVCEFLNFVA